MTTKGVAKKAVAGVRKGKRHVEAITDAVAGAAAGAAFGAMAGPPGVAIGAVLGTAVGAGVGLIEEREVRRRGQHDAELDQQIGVDGGDLGAPNLKHPPAAIGAFSSSSLGVGGSGEGVNPAEGPMQEVDS